MSHGCSRSWWGVHDLSSLRSRTRRDSNGRLQAGNTSSASVDQVTRECARPSATTCTRSVLRRLRPLRATENGPKRAPMANRHDPSKAQGARGWKYSPNPKGQRKAGHLRKMAHHLLWFAETRAFGPARPISSSEVAHTEAVASGGFARRGQRLSLIHI